MADKITKQKKKKKQEAFRKVLFNKIFWKEKQNNTKSGSSRRWTVKHVVIIKEQNTIITMVDTVLWYEKIEKKKSCKPTNIQRYTERRLDRYDCSQQMMMKLYK